MPRKSRRRRWPQASPPQDATFHRQTASLVVSEAESTRPLRCAKHPVLLEQVVNDGLLLSIDPAGEQQVEERERRRQRIHGESVPDALPGFEDDVDWPNLQTHTPPSGYIDPPIPG